MKNVLFIFAHIDDETFGPFGTINKLREQGYKINILTFCGNGRRVDVNHAQRLDAYEYITDVVLNADVKLLEYYDLELDKIPLIELASQIEQCINVVRPEMVFTHYQDDLHQDHQVVSLATKIAVRPTLNSPVKRLYEYETIGGTTWSTKPFDANKFVSLTEREIENKKSYLSMYKQELKEWPDPRSVDGVEHLAHYNGMTISSVSAEAFRLVYDRDQRI